jgi:primosomal replication protein N
VPEGVEYEESLSSPHMLSAATVHSQAQSKLHVKSLGHRGVGNRDTQSRHGSAMHFSGYLARARSGAEGKLPTIKIQAKTSHHP